MGSLAELLLPAAGSTVLMTFSVCCFSQPIPIYALTTHRFFFRNCSSILSLPKVIDAMKLSSKVRYAVLDDEGKKLLAHPYAPWQDVPKAKSEQAAKAYRASRAYENAKEWLQLSLPVMGLFQVYGSSIPYVKQAHVDCATVTLATLWTMANSAYVKGYVEDAEKRVTGFKRRTLVFKVWALSSIAAIACCAVNRYFPKLLPA